MSFLVDFLVWGTRLSKITHRGEPLEWHMDDLVKRLRDKEMSFSECWDVMPKAADRIEALEAGKELVEHQAVVLGTRLEILEHNNKKLHELVARYEDALRQIAEHWAPSVNEWATKLKGIASKALEGK